MNEARKKELMKKYNVKQVGSGNFGEGFFSALNHVDTQILKKENVKEIQLETVRKLSPYLNPVAFQTILRNFHNNIDDPLNLQRKKEARE